MKVFVEMTVDKFRRWKALNRILCFSDEHTEGKDGRCLDCGKKIGASP